MSKSKLFASLTLLFAALAILTTMTVARSAYAAGDDVFMDEGDGDFDAMPAPPKENAPHHEETAVPKVAAPQPAMNTEDAVHEEIPQLTDDSSAAQPAPAPTEEVAKPATDVKPKADKKKKKAKEKTAQVETPAPTEAAAAPVAAKGQFVTTKDACPMMRSPASTGETMLTVKASKKIWVEDAGDGYWRAFNKAGEPGYVAKDCVQ